MKTKVSKPIYIDILNETLVVALTEKLMVNEIRFKQKGGRVSINSFSTGIVEVSSKDDLSKVYAKTKDKSFIYLTPEIDYNVPLTKQVKTPCKLSNIYDKLIFLLENNSRDRNPIAKFQAVKYYGVKDKDDTFELLDVIIVNRTRKYAQRSKKKLKVSLSHNQIKLLTLLRDENPTTNNRAQTYVFGKESYLSPIPLLIDSLWWQLHKLGCLVIEFDGETILLRYRDSKEKIPPRSRFRLIA